MILVDSSGWIEVFTGGPLTSGFRAYLDSGAPLVVPTVVLYEVYKVVCREASEEQAKMAAARLRRNVVLPLDEALALEAADLSLEHHLSMADAIVYATARSCGATLVTSDEHFQGLPGVEYLPPG